MSLPHMLDTHHIHRSYGPQHQKSLFDTAQLRIILVLDAYEVLHSKPGAGQLVIAAYNNRHSCTTVTVDLSTGT